MNPFTLPVIDRIRCWRELREELVDLDKRTQLERTNLFWWQAPIVNYALNYDAPSTWPTPWELIQENGFDSTARAYMMAETLFSMPNSPWNNDEILLFMIKDKEDIKTILGTEHWVINHEYNTVSPIDSVLQNAFIIDQYIRDEEGSWSQLT
jgi:hypothetical protein